MRIARIEAFQVQWRTEDPPSARSGFLRVWSDDGRCGLGEVSPMQGGLVSLTILKHHIGPALVGADPLDHAVIHDRLLHRLVKLGPEGALTSALAALDIALWDLKGQLLGQPIWRLLGGAWRTALPFYPSIGGNGATRSMEEVLRIVEARMRDKPAAIRSVSTTTAWISTARYRITSPRRARAGRQRFSARFRRQQRLHAGRRHARGAGPRGAGILGGSRGRAASPTPRAMGEVARKLSITVWPASRATPRLQWPTLSSPASRWTA